MMGIFDAIVYQPVYNTIVFFADLFPGANFGIAIIATTILIKFLFLSLSKKQIESQKKLQEIQPKLKEIQAKYKDDKERQAKELMNFYRENKVNPFAGCLPLIVQIVFLITIYHVIMKISQMDFSVDSAILYSFVANPGVLSHTFFGIADLAKPSILFAVLAAIGQYYQMKMLIASQPKKQETEKKDDTQPDFATIMNKQMLYIGPVLTLWVGITFPAGLSLYWLVSTVFAIIQQIFIFRKREEAKS
jgi:YidC/Oxa1 family membrane protein insertase